MNMENKILLLIGISILTPVFLVNAYASNPENYKPEITLISGVAIGQVDPNYKNLPIDNSKETYVVYLDGRNLSATKTSGIWDNGSSSENVVIEGNCLNTYEIPSGIRTNDACEQIFFMPMKYWTETQIGKFLIFQ